MTLSTLPIIIGFCVTLFTFYLVLVSEDPPPILYGWLSIVVLSSVLIAAIFGPFILGIVISSLLVP